MNIRDLQIESHATARANGFYDSPPTIQDRLVLIHSEVSEALEEWRNPEHGLTEIYYGGEKPEGFGIELADILIRVADCAEYLRIDLEECLREKLAYNKTRSYRHGNKRA
jgi:NTP pyrophosphatase (non-canonical NTP hydrolase)